MDAAAEIGRNPVCKHQIQSGYGNEQADAGRDSQTPSRETKFSGANGVRQKLHFPVRLPTRRIGNLTSLIHTLARCDDHKHHNRNVSDEGRCFRMSQQPVRTGGRTWAGWPSVIVIGACQKGGRSFRIS